MSTYVGLTNFQKQSGFLAHPVVLCCEVSVEHGIAFILKKKLYDECRSVLCMGNNGKETMKVQKR